MIAWVRPSLGLVGRIVAILLLTVTVEFVTSTLMYERASEFSLREDEAHRLAEHLVIARKLIAERPVKERHVMARLLTTDRYDVRWSASQPPPPPLAPELVDMRRQIIAWEPGLASSDLRLRLASPGRNAVVIGGLTLSDGSWVYFGTREVMGGWDLALGRILLAFIPALGLVVIGVLLVRQTLQPMKMLAQGAERFGLGDRVDLPEMGTGEVRRVIRAFNVMQERIHRLINDRTQALAAVGHDLRTPIARLQLRIEGVENPAVREALDRDAAEMEGMIASLLAFLGGDANPEKPVRVDVAILAATIVDDVFDHGHDIIYSGPDNLEATLRPLDLKRALGNLVSNAVRYGKKVELSLGQQDGNLIFRVLDDGPGIPEHRLEEAMQPFVRLEAARGRNTHGLGLGLAIVQLIVEREGGALRLFNRPEGGLVAEIQLPAGQ